MPSIQINGLKFRYEDDGAGEPLIFLHGFTGQTASWSPIKKRVNASFRTIAIDLIGHGMTNAPSDIARYAFSQAIDDVAEIISRLQASHATWIGYSMGGRLALALALRYPKLVSTLILESASPGIADPAAREARRQADELLADRINDRGIPEFVTNWEALPMWQSQRHLPADILDRQRQIRLRNSAVGLAGSLRGMGTGAQESLWDDLPHLQAPTLLIAGALDTKFADIATRMSEQIPNAELLIVPHAGHAVHLEQPEICAAHISCFAANHTMATKSL